jgi:hypothetical protein
MLRTEEEAFSTICCKPGAEHDPRMKGTCVGRGCMAWRWEPAGDVTIRQSGKPGVARRGYCGLAGKPEVA